MKVWYLPLERYRERYTEQLEIWATSRLARRGVSFATIGANAATTSITTGPVLDAHRRASFGLYQTAELIGALERGQVGTGDVIWLADMFQPGYEAIPYCLAQQGIKPIIVAQCWAQSVDPNDFTFPMRRWMRPYELMVAHTADRLFVASTALQEMLQAAMIDCPITVSGLPFSLAEVRARAPYKRLPLPERPKRIVYTSRLDREKQPHFFLDLAEDARSDPTLQAYRFAIVTGAPFMRSNDPNVVERVCHLAEKGVIDLFVGCDKPTYYQHLIESRVQFNCALQDFVSYTMLEASALGTATLAPAHLAFPEALFNDERFLYVPWSQRSARDQLVMLLDTIAEDELDPDDVERPSRYHDGSLDRMIDAMLALAERGAGT